jgi:hypothetical protein
MAVRIVELEGVNPDMLDLVIEVEPFRLEIEQAFGAQLAPIVIAAILVAPSPGKLSRRQCCSKNGRAHQWNENPGYA